MSDDIKVNQLDNHKKKKEKTEPKEVISISIDPWILKTIDKIRGNTSRSEFIRNSIKYYLGASNA